MPLFESAEALTDFLENIAVVAVDDVGEIITDIVKENVRTIVYDPYDQLVRSYERLGENGGFLGSWTHDVTFNMSGNPQALIESDSNLIKVDPPRHGQSFEESSGDIIIDTLNKMGGSGEGDRSTYMDKAIAEGSHYDFYVSPDAPNYWGSVDNWWTRPRDYFSPSLRRINRERIVEKNAEASFRSHNSGIKIIKKTV